MIDHLFSAAIAICLLAGEAAVLMHSMSDPRDAAAASAQVVQLPRVEVVAQRSRQVAIVVVAEASARAH